MRRIYVQESMSFYNQSSKLWIAKLSSNLFCRLALIGLLLVVFCHTALARPQTVTEEKTEGEATISLKLEDTFILDDALMPCEITLVVRGEDKELTAGDTIKVKLIEDDVPFTELGDDLKWEVD